MRFQNIRTKRGYIYILTNKRRSVLYIGVTANLKERIWKHKQGKGSIFARKYQLKYLVYYEVFEHMDDAIDREKQLKNWHRDWKFSLIKKTNPTLKDLWPEVIN